MLQQHYNQMRTLLLVFAVFATIVNAGIFTPKVALKCPATGEDATQNEVANPCQPGGIYNTNTALFSGTYVCRHDSYLVFWSRNTTVCIPTLTGAAIAEEGDKCGCCDEAGNTVECPPPCSCICSHDDNPHVLLYKTGAFGQKDTECMSKSKASRFVVDIRKGDYSCVPDDECPTLAPTASPTTEGTAAYKGYSDYGIDIEEESATP